jgi:hypothetical protein
MGFQISVCDPLRAAEGVALDQELNREQGPFVGQGHVFGQPDRAR